MSESSSVLLIIEALLSKLKRSNWSVQILQLRLFQDDTWAMLYESTIPLELKTRFELGIWAQHVSYMETQIEQYWDLKTTMNDTDIVKVKLVCSLLFK